MTEITVYLSACEYFSELDHILKHTVRLTMRCSKRQLGPVLRYAYLHKYLYDMQVSFYHIQFVNK